MLVTRQPVFRHVWHGGLDANDSARLQALHETLAPVRDPESAAVKAQLRENTERAAASGVFGVPTIVSSGRNFWGDDAIAMLSEHLRGNPWFDGPTWDAAALPRGGVQRR